MTRVAAIAIFGSSVSLGAIAPPRQSATSPESRHVARLAFDARLARDRSLALFGSRAGAISELWAIARECNAPDWDGYDAQPIDIESASVAEKLLRCLPEGLAIPEITPESDGHISLDWIMSRHRVLSVTASPNGRLAVAWLNGSNRGHMVERFDGERIPTKILALIHEITRA